MLAASMRECVQPALLTLLAINGVHPKVVQELAGYYSSQVSTDIYTHVNMGSKREAVNAVPAVNGKRRREWRSPVFPAYEAT